LFNGVEVEVAQARRIELLNKGFVSGPAPLLHQTRRITDVGNLVVNETRKNAVYSLLVVAGSKGCENRADHEHMRSGPDLTNIHLHKVVENNRSARRHVKLGPRRARGIEQAAFPLFDLGCRGEAWESELGEMSEQPGVAGFVTKMLLDSLLDLRTRARMPIA
jgi:hypothetical protein